MANEIFSVGENGRMRMNIDVAIAVVITAAAIILALQIDGYVARARHWLNARVGVLGRRIMLW